MDLNRGAAFKMPFKSFKIEEGIYCEYYYQHNNVFFTIGVLGETCFMS